MHADSGSKISDRNLILSIEKAAKALDFMADAHAAVSVTDVARSLSWTSSTAHRILVSLRRTGLVEQDEGTQKYRLGYRLLQLAQAKLESVDVRSEGLQAVEDLRASTGETVSLFVPRPEGALCVHQLPSVHQVRFVSYVGHIIPLGHGAVGQVLSSTQHASIEVAQSTGTVTQGTCALAAPILDSAGRVCWALAIAVPDQRWNEDRVTQWSIKLQRAAWNASMHLGWRGPQPG